MFRFAGGGLGPLSSLFRVFNPQSLYSFFIFLNGISGVMLRSDASVGNFLRRINLKMI